MCIHNTNSLKIIHLEIIWINLLELLIIVLVP
jgi:hypothetical protein